MQKYNHAFGENDIRGIYSDDITEELFYNIAIPISYRTQINMIHCSKRSSYRHKWYATDKKQKIKQKQICHFIQKNNYRIIR